jgi:inosine/xanthosine triphosphatase
MTRIVYIASSNPVKLKAARQGFALMFPDELFDFRTAQHTVSISSQPITDEETLAGAEARAKNIREHFPDGDLWVGIEGGSGGRPEGMGTYAWVVVLDKARVGRGRSGEFFLPKKVADLVRQGMELGHADDLVFSRNNSKQENGAIGLLTDDAVDRAGLYVPAVVFALIPFKHLELYPLD